MRVIATRRAPRALAHVAPALTLALALALAGCPTANTPDAGTPAADAVVVFPLDAEPIDVGAPDAQPTDALAPDAEPIDVGFVLRGSLQPGATEAQAGTSTLRGRFGVTTSTRARTRTHSIVGGLAPLGY